jgi:2-polyprenyl-6-methoxyphenol hydroxylase-like FAD-dependent oxidoreductase
MSKPNHIVVVGGGTAGWMAACLLNHAWGGDDSHRTQVTLIESSDIATIGVGEGSTPYMRQFFSRLGIAEKDWMPACNATYKCGISFPGWSTKPGFETYFHPFFSRLDLEPAADFFTNCNRRRRGKSIACHPNDYFVAAELARQKKAPIPLEDLGFEHDYAYHFDAGLLASFLKRFALERGVRHVIDTVKHVEQNQDGSLAALQTHQHGRLGADWFFDCSGFASLLIGKTLQEPFHSFADTLFNDSAVAMPSPLNPEQPIPSETVSRAAGHGWIWRIPLTSRYGNGYVYSSKYLQPEQAEAELRKVLGAEAEGIEARHLKMRVGRVDNHWQKNCVAAGLSQGFIEPLEATAIGLIQFTIERFIDFFEKGEFTDQYRDEFNAEVNKSFDGVKDYVSLHYRLNSRADTTYWTDNREQALSSPSLQRIMAAWDEGRDFDAALTAEKTSQAYMRPSWYCIFSGMGRFDNVAEAKFTRSAKAARQLCESLAHRFHPHRAAWLAQMN